ncbi:protein of unknown function DUF445 [Zymomonas mobilis subsp. pomaceae ATCC 29192]|uniref:DUF445 domain-containing protein n=1 Tax=Zymomonas mobilis subsp. pomaceae (strain ATCC 29192 / DSM 22645 / JCM 10191 / CCUG 17912 / NBRC 13757 / NCIMB 11200 / NRRL B-4491 / Barker I) TaxID=579138 RepID=F8ESL9_ZYMMT|nr:protein of unknown function DUF445 [Zymomonas mobilis subsp. pomaceae ATCC 29192]
MVLLTQSFYRKFRSSSHIAAMMKLNVAIKHITVSTAATLILGVMVVLFIAALEYDRFYPGHIFPGFVVAFAEAAMVGGLADWFAVTALFRHPLGLPFPHTALIPQAKDRIAANLALFIEQHFLRSIVLSRRLKNVDASRFLLRLTDATITHDNALKNRLQRLLPKLWAHIDYPTLSEEITSWIIDIARHSKPAPIIGDACQAYLEKGTHITLISGILRSFADWLAHHESMIREMVSERSGSFLRWTGLDNRLADSIYEAITRLVNEMMVNPEHPLRLRFNETLFSWAEKIQEDAIVQRRIDKIKNTMVDNPTFYLGLREKIENLTREFFLDKHEDTSASKRSLQLKALVAAWGRAVTEDEQIKTAINRAFRRIIVGVIVPHSHQITRLITDTVEGWDGDIVAGRIEKAVGNELHYIRLSGTFVGGSIGLLLHAFNQLIS